MCNCGFISFRVVQHEYQYCCGSKLERPCRQAFHCIVGKYWSIPPESAHAAAQARAPSHPGTKVSPLETGICEYVISLAIIRKMTEQHTQTCNVSL